MKQEVAPTPAELLELRAKHKVWFGLNSTGGIHSRKSSRSNLFVYFVLPEDKRNIVLNGNKFLAKSPQL